MIFRSTYSRPILLAGNGVRMGNASHLVYEFADKTEIPVLTTMNGVDLAQDDIHIGFIGTHGNRVANMIINEADLIISVGARLGLRQVGRYTDHFAPNADLIRADIDQYELSRNIKENEVKTEIGAEDFMRQLLSEDIPNYRDWKKCCMEAKKILDQYDKAEGNLAVEEISSLLPEDPIVAVDVGQHQCWCAQSLHLKGRKGRIHISGGYGTMGCALPFSIGSSIATGSGTVFCITGDGGLQMNIQEFETVKREELPIKIFVLNNKVLGKISETQQLRHDRRFAQTTEKSGYSVPDFQKVAEAYGIRSATLGSYHELKEYSEWIKDEKPVLLNIMLPSESYLIPKIQWETGQTLPTIPADVEEKVYKILRS